MTQITALPVPPSREDPDNFATRADSFLAALPLFATEANALAEEVGDHASSAAQNAALAEAAATSASTIASASMWSAGLEYVTGQAVISPTDYQVYIRVAPGGVDSTDPVGAPLLWERANKDMIKKTGDTVPGVIQFDAVNIFSSGQRFESSFSGGGLAALSTNEDAASLAQQLFDAAPVGFPVGPVAIVLHREGDANYRIAFGIDTDNQLAIGGFSLGAVRRRVYLESNVVGTVSQSGGIPTGAIIEKGSNANGEWVKFADGTMYQTGVYPTSAGDRVITFPQAFATVRSVWANHPSVPSGGTQAVVVNCHSTNSSGTTVSPRTISGGTVAIASGAGNWNAYGRWFV